MTSNQTARTAGVLYLLSGIPGVYSEGKSSFIRDVERRAAIWRSAGRDLEIRWSR